jgi:hypothetical protein
MDFKIPLRPSPGKAAKIAGWSPTKILNKVHSGELEATTDGSHIYIVGPSLERLLASQKPYKPGSIRHARAVNLEKSKK